MDASLFTSMLFATVVAGTPLIIVALGLLVNEKAGVLNLGAEGMMAMGAVAAFAVTHHSGSPWLGVMAGMAAAMAVSLIFGFLTLTLQANQVAAGLALSIFGVGLSAFIGKPFESIALPAVPPIRIPFIADLPLIGEALYNQQALVYLSWALFWVVVWFLYRSRAGLVLRAVGESPASAHAIGHPVILIRYLAVLFGGAMAGMGGAFLSVFYTPMWVEGMVAGRGWIALALVVFATWRPLRVMIGAYLFGGVMITQLFIQGSGMQLDFPAQFLSSLPYWATIIVLVVISRNVNTIRLNSPMSLGKPYRAEG
ncbi:ABC transporter permease [Azoarcus communis]|uniref:ABC transporter permease n=1 Tax=Parazoarcus communis SWub3 = DSM 12120 TaxID=1121029 RepID=A0A323UVR0_9RHOO|nr:ABC transporter permease [Parazoarcus communis]NMG48378.1 ABC transporter permease [Parazoarcus communis]NMG70595.1 ABC transporter permease [Parazoarcus communis SWub3 = DSM 12120]PZA15750.1 ABC transporter permease [Azoarcus communis] [Parazoarcus communis SWub3 = DSM 12120]